MDSKDFYIKKFEQHNLELVKVIEDWYEQSIKMNWNEVRILVNEFNIPNCPKGHEWDNVKKINKTYEFIQKTCSDITDYLMAKGFTHVEVWGCQTEFGSDGCWHSGTSVRASMHKNIEK